jgi:hypothetical protein
MRRLFASALLALALTPGAAPATAQDRVTLGRGTLFSNDALGDGRDRWRTGSYSVSIPRGPSWSGSRPARPGEILEWRLRAEVIAPARLGAPAANDRRYAGLATLGLHTHFARGPVEYSAGVDAVFVGPMTQLGGFQSAVHDSLGLASPAAALRGQLGNAVHPTLVLEAGLPFQAGAVRMRPFVEAQAGIETFGRAGIDVTIGAFGFGELSVRESATGHLYRATKTAPPTGPSFVLGGDVAYVTGSALLPGGGGAVLRPVRTRLRAGMHWQGERAEVFYGITRLGREFESQAVEQTVGSVHLRLRF